VRERRTAVNLVEEIYRHSLNLPPDAARTALEFIEFLETRTAAVPAAPSGVSATEAFLARHAGALGDDFPDDIDDSDLGQDAQRRPLG
jgi:hypothetical protein